MKNNVSYRTQNTAFQLPETTTWPGTPHGAYATAAALLAIVRPTAYALNDSKVRKAAQLSAQLSAQFEQTFERRDSKTFSK